MAKNKGGRPAKVLDEAQVLEVETLAAVLKISQIADYFGISDKTFRDIKNRQPEVLTAYKRGRAKAIQDIGGNLISTAKSGNTAAQIFYLKTQGGWSETVKGEDEEDEAEPMSITYTVSPAKGEIQVTNAKT